MPDFSGRHRRRRGGTRSGSRRKHSWVELRSETNSTMTPANTRREIVLLLPLDDSEEVTLIRVVGSVFMGLQQDAAVNVVQLMAWGIYVSDSGSQGDLNLDPMNTLDIANEEWMMLKGTYDNTAVNNSTVSNIAGAMRVDIRVSRKVPEGTGIKLVFNSNANYVSAAYLRGLVLLT